MNKIEMVAAALIVIVIISFLTGGFVK